jgi:hypothetical protein
MLHKSFFLLLLAGILTACTEDFQEINTNPNAPVDVQPGLLLRQVQWNYAEQMSYEGFVAGNLLGQYFTAIDFNLFDRHSLTESQFGGNPWDILYVNLRDNEIILEKAQQNPALAVYEGPARILKAYMTAALTDIFGDVPYSEAFAGKAGLIAPTYDRQEDIYTAAGGILDQLDEGIAAIENYQGPTPLEGDILFHGDLSAWVKLGNALKLKYLMRISGQVDVAAQVDDVFQSGNFIQTNAENASFDFSSPPNNFRMSTARVGDYNVYIMSETIEEILKELDDPRIAVFFRPTGNDPTAFKGLLNGPDASQLSITVADYSLTGRIWREEAMQLDANFMTAAETHFLLAEAAQKGYINAGARELYEAGVRLSFEYWQSNLPEDYLSSGAAAFGANGTDPIEQIITQKWLHNIGNGYEGWIEYRRTGFPKLKTVAASLNNDLIPVRMPYPTTEATLNRDNFEQAAAATNGNSVNSAVWWDAN